MNITLANLPVGKWRYFTPDEIHSNRGIRILLQ
jgi:hypothetical protein